MSPSCARTPRSASPTDADRDTQVPEITPEEELDLRFLLPSAPCQPAGGRAGRPHRARRARDQADRRAGHRPVRRPGRQPAPGPGRAVPARRGPRLLHDRLRRARGQRGGRGGPAPHRIPRCSTTAPAPSTWPAPRRYQAPSRCGTSCSGWSPPARSRSRAAVTRSSGTTPWPSSRRPPRSRRTCRAPSGIAFSIGRAAKLGVPSPWPADAITVASFGDASTSHSTATGAINAACRTAYQGLPMPLLLVCEDNGLGISVRTPDGWVAAAHSGRPALRYFSADGCDPVACFDAATAAAAYVRASRSPAFLHLKLVRFLGHAGSDAEISYRSRAEIAADYARDPLLGTARLIVAAGLLSPGQVIGRYEALRAQVRDDRRRGRDPPPAGQPRRGHRARWRRATPTRWRAGPPRPAAPGPRVRLRPQAAGGRRAADPGRHDQPRPRRCASPPTRSCWSSARTSGRKGGVYGVTRGWPGGSASAGSSTPCSTSRRSSGSASARACPACSRCRRSSTSPTCTTPRTSSAARRPACSSSPPASTATRWWSASRAWATRRASAATSTTTTPSACCATFPGLVVAVPARAQDAAPMLRTCLAAAQRRRHRLRLPGADRALPRPRPVPAGRRRLAVALRRPGALGGRARADRARARLRRRNRPHPGHVRERAPHVAAGGARGSPPPGSAYGSSTCGGSLRCPPSSCAPKPSGPAASWW